MKPDAAVPRLRRLRRKALSLLKAGWTYRQVARQTKVSLSSVVRWHQVYRQSGRRGLQRVRPRGRPSQLSDTEKKRLLAVLGEGSLAYGYLSNSWTLKRIAQVIRQEFGVRYVLSTVWHLMHALGWSCQRPTKKARERNEQFIRYWMQVLWPRIKKRPGHLVLPLDFGTKAAFYSSLLLPEPGRPKARRPSSGVRAPGRRSRRSRS